MLELGLNLKKCIRFCKRSEKNLMHFFEFKADSNIGCALLFYTLLFVRPLRTFKTERTLRTKNQKRTSNSRDQV